MSGSEERAVLDVSVVVPVYNPGRYLVDCANSLLAQTVPVGRREFIFVDDGSTDESPETLDRLAARHPDVHVIHEENSGWSGKPRNVGLAHAQGEYVFFCDHDDMLWPEALERMLAMARRTGADVLIPKMVSNGRPVPRRLFRHNIDRASLITDAVSSALTPHKLFRRAFLIENGLRYPEDVRRLEDHVFVTEAFLRAQVISVLADYPCYVRVRREDNANAALQRWEAQYYFKFVAEVIDVIEANTQPGELRDAMLMRPYANELLGKLSDRRWRRWDRRQRRQIFDQVRMLMTTRFPPDFHERLRIVRRAHARAVLGGRIGLLRKVARSATRTAVQATVRRLRRNADHWVFDFNAELSFDDGSPIRLTPLDGDGWAVDTRLIPPPLATPPYTASDVLNADVDVLLVDRSSGVEWYLPSDSHLELVPIVGDRHGANRLVFRGEVRVDPMTAAGGAPLPPAKWDLRVRAHVLGLSRSCRMRYRRGRTRPLRSMSLPSGLRAKPYLAGQDEYLGFRILPGPAGAEPETPRERATPPDQTV